jgi:hypothetical protein
MKKSVQFTFTLSEMQKLTNYCDPDMVVCGKDYLPEGSPPWAEIITKTETHRLIEGQYVTKTKNGYTIK